MEGTTYWGELAALWPYHAAGLLVFSLAAASSFRKHGWRLSVALCVGTIVAESVVLAIVGVTDEIRRHGFWPEIQFAAAMVALPLVIASLPFLLPRRSWLPPTFRCLAAIILGILAVPLSVIPMIVAACTLFEDCR